MNIVNLSFVLLIMNTIAQCNPSQFINLYQQYVSFTEFRESGFWVGAEDNVFEGQWRWLETGTALGPYTKWASGYPTRNETTNCLVMKFEGTTLFWMDDNCVPWAHGKERGGNHFYICEKPYVFSFLCYFNVKRC